MQPRFPSIPGRIKLQRNHAQRKQGKIGHLPKIGGEPQKTHKTRPFPNKTKGHLGSRYLISISFELFYPKVFCVLVWGAVLCRVPLRWNGRIRIILVVFVPHCSSRFPIGFRVTSYTQLVNFCEFKSPFWEYYFLKGGGILFHEPYRLPPRNEPMSPKRNVAPPTLIFSDYVTFRKEHIYLYIPIWSINIYIYTWYIYTSTLQGVVFEP